jgi:hypothetical protein
MAVEYPVDLSGNKITLQEPDYSKGIFKVIQKLVSDLNDLSSVHNELTEDTQEIVNDLKDKIDALEEATDVDVEELQESINKLKSILDDADTELDIVGTLDVLADELNARETIVKKRVLFNSDTGKVAVDISDFNFENKDDYEVLVSAEALTQNGNVNPAVVAFNKKDEKTFEVYAYDRRKFVEVNPAYVDGAEQDDDGNYPNAFGVVVGIMYKRPIISRSIKTVDDKEATIGE